MSQTEEQKAAAKAAKEAEAKRLSDEADKTAAKEAERIAKEDAEKAEKAKAERAQKAEEALQREEAAASDPSAKDKAAKEAAVEAAKNQAVIDKVDEVVINVLSMHDIVEKNDDVYIYENVRLPKNYAGEKGVKKFEGDNGQVIYYTQVLVKKFSQNVVTDGASEEALDEE